MLAALDAGAGALLHSGSVALAASQSDGQLPQTPAAGCLCRWALAESHARPVGPGPLVTT